MLFKKRTDYLPKITNAYGTTLRAEITREFPIESIRIRVQATYSATAATYAAGKNAYDIFSRIQLNVSDGARTRNVIDVTGRGLSEYARQIQGTIGAVYLNRARATAAATTVQYVFPLNFALPQISDPVSSALLLPTTRFNSNPVLSLTTCAAATSIWATNAPTIDGIWIQINRRDVDDPKWEYWDTELSEQEYALAATGVQSLELPIPGAYTGMLLGCRQSDNTFENLKANEENRLQYLGNVVRRFTAEDVRSENEESIVDAVGTMDAGWHYLDFLTDRVGESVEEVGSVLETNFLMATGARLNLLVNNNTASNKLSVLSHRIYGDIQRLKAVRK